MMISINYNLINLENIFKVNWIIGFLVFLSPLLFLPLPFIDIYDRIVILDDGLKQDIMFSKILQIDIVYTVIGLLFSVFIIRVGRYFFIFLLFYFFAFFFFYFSYLAAMFNSFQHSDNKINLEFTCLLSILTSFGSILFFIACRNTLKKFENSSWIIICGLLSYLLLNCGGLIRVMQFNYPAGLLFIGITSFYFLIYKYGQKFILMHFNWFIVINIFLLFIPFYVSYFYELSFYDMSYLWSIKCYSDISNDFVDINLSVFLQYMILFLNPYQLVVFPLYFCFNAYIIAKKMNEEKDREYNDLSIKISGNSSRNKTPL